MSCNPFRSVAGLPGEIFALLCTALAAVAIAPDHPVTRYVDLLGSVVVAYLLWSGLRASHVHLTARQTLDETVHRYAS